MQLSCPSRSRSRPDQEEAVRMLSFSLGSSRNLGERFVDRNRTDRQRKMASARRNRAMAIEKRIRAAASSRNLNLGSPGHGISRCEDGVGEFGCCFRRALMRNRENFRKSRAPSRFMFYKDSQWNDYPDEVLSVLKEAFVNGRAAVYLETESGCFIVDFLRMLEVNLGHGSHRSVAWIDEEGHCFFPELFSECSGESCASEPNMEIQLGVRCGALDTAESDALMPTPKEELQLPPHDSRVQGGISPDLVPQDVPSVTGLLLRLKETDRAHNIVKSVFLKGMRKLSSKAYVTAVYRCSTGARLQDFKMVVERTEAARGHANVRYAWYGTTVKDVGKIVMHGFGKSNLCSGPESFGIGINLYPASCSCLSASMAETDINGDHHIILCRVIMGNVEEVQFGSEQACPSCDEFDNGVDDALNTKRYILWRTNMNSHILPEYVLTFRDSLHPKGAGSPTKSMEETFHNCEAPYADPNGTNAASEYNNIRYSARRPKMSFPYLFAELEKSIPFSKTKALNFLYNGYKAGKISKNVLIAKVRSIVGDGLLVSTIKSITRQSRMRVCGIGCSSILAVAARES